MIKKIFFFIIISVFMQVQSVLAASFEKYAGEFAYLGAGPRGTAMGGAFTAVANDVTSIYWNPAGLIEAKGFQAHFMHSKHFISSIQNNFLAFSIPYTRESTIGLSLYYLTVNEIKDSRNAYNFAEGKVDPSKVKLFNTGDYIISASYARIYDENLNWGANLKIIYRDYELETATGIGFDIAVKYTLDNLKLGAVLRDATGTLIAWSTNTTQFITPSLRLGTAYNFVFVDYDLSVTPALDLNLLGEGREYGSQLNLAGYSADILAGMEISYNNLFDLRVGIDDLQRLNSGVGIHLPHVKVDYAFTAYENELGDIHRISLNVNFGDLISIPD